MAVDLPRAPRIAAPGFDRSVGFDVLTIGVAGLVSPFVLPAGGGLAVLLLLVAAAGVAIRRRTLGAYEGEHGLVVRNYLSTRLVSWPEAVTVEAQRDRWLPWLRVAAVKRTDGTSLVVSALRHVGEPTQEVLVLTRVVRERREALSRETWRD